MKKFIFILVVLAWSGILILLSFSREGKGVKSPDTHIDFREWERLYFWDTDKKTFTETDFVSKKISPDTLYFRQFSPVDGIYYRSWDKNPFAIEKKSNTNIITFGSGLYICSLRSGLEQYEFHINDLSISPKGRGVFLVDTAKEQVSVFPFDIFLEMGLVGQKKQSHVTDFTLFPSLLFKHDIQNTKDLIWSDILRISFLDSIRYVDMKTPEDRKILFSWDSATWMEEMFLQAQADIIDRITAFTALYTSTRNQSDKKSQNSSFFDTSSTLLINGSKKEIFLKNTLIKNIVQLIGNQKQSWWTSIESILSEMKELSPEAYADGISILRQHYYITLFSHFTSTEGSSVLESPLVPLAEKIITKESSSKQGEYYTHISDLFSVYYFLTLSQQHFNASFEKILQKTLESKVLTKSEFLPFVFFVTQYLSSGPVIPNESTMLIINHLFQITNEYYNNNKTNESKLITTTSTIFYNYTRIFSKIYRVFLDVFIDKTPAGLLLKPVYQPDGDDEIKPSLVSAFTKVINNAKVDAEDKKTILYSKWSFQSNPQIIDSYTLLKSTLAWFDTLISMFDNYPKYLNDFHLNDSNKSAKGILVEKGNEMSTEILQTYLKNFNNLDTANIRISNNFTKDNFYEAQVTILWNIFHFKLWEQGHVLADISYTDTFGKKHTFPNITIPLDQKEEQLRDLFGSSDNPVLRYKYDFKNFFEITFLKGDTSLSSISTSNTDHTTNLTDSTPEIQLFIQQELLDKDFKNINTFLPIGFKDIQASINSEWDYVIELSNIAKTFAWSNSSHSIQLDGKYLFKRHSFSRLKFKIKKENDAESYELDGTTVEILPARIALLGIPETLKDLGYYIDTIKSSYTNQQSIIIDLTGKRVLLDNTPFVTIFPTK